MPDASMPFVYENLRLIDAEISKTQRALVALYKHREAAIQPIIDLARLTPPAPLRVPMRGYTREDSICVRGVAPCNCLRCQP